MTNKIKSGKSLYSEDNGRNFLNGLMNKKLDMPHKNKEYLNYIRDFKVYIEIWNSLRLRTRLNKIKNFKKYQIYALVWISEKRIRYKDLIT